MFKIIKKLPTLLAFIVLSSHSLQASLKGPVLDVAVVGAGLTGLTAGMHLAERKVDYKIFEAKPQSGGRAISIKLPDGTVFNAGGEWIDQDHKQIIGLAKTLKVSLQKEYYDKEFLMTHKAAPIAIGDQVVLFGGCLEKLKKEKDSENFTERTYNMETLKFNPLTAVLPKDLTEVEGAFLETFIQADYGKGMDGVSGSLSVFEELIENLGPYHKIQSSRNKLSALVINTVLKAFAYRYRVQGGMGNLINALDAKNKGRVEHNRVLTALHKEKELFVLEFGQKSVLAKSVILTIPLGVLRKIQGFNSESIGLSEEQIEAVQTIQYGTNSKVMVKNLDPAPFNYHLDLDRKTTTWESPNKDGLVIFMGGDNGEKLTLESAQILMQAALNKDAPIADNQFAIKNWSEDPFALGSYSVPSPLVSMLLHKQSIVNDDEWSFADPVDGFKLAGEATMIESGLLESAVKSGLNAANDIFRFLKKLD